MLNGFCKSATLDDIRAMPAPEDDTCGPILDGLARLIPALEALGEDAELRELFEKAERPQAGAAGQGAGS